MRSALLVSSVLAGVALVSTMARAPTAFAAPPSASSAKAAPAPAVSPAKSTAAAAPATATTAATSPGSATTATSGASANATSATSAPTALAATSSNGAATPSGSDGPPSKYADTEHPHDSGDELYGETYVFIGARYRGTVLPEFLLSPFVKETGSFYLNQVGAEIEFRTNGFSIIPALTFSEYSTGGNVLILEAGKPENLAGNWSVINSSMKAINANVDFLWSKKLSRKLDFEYGFGLGIGAVFDSLVINWVYEDANGPYKSASGRSFTPCAKGDDLANKRGCSAADHSNSKNIKIGNYEEPSWFSGGAKPNVLLNLTVPHLGLRYKPDPKLVLRVGTGFSLTGFWFGLSGSFGLSKPLAKSKPAGKPSDVESEEVYQ